jgi:hypothetical protein
LADVAGSGCASKMAFPCKRHDITEFGKIHVLTDDS